MTEKTSRVHITPHMHWDREWYFTTEESRILLVNNMEEILQRLETDPDYKYYVMDGQTAVLEDYFAIKPENRERVKAQVQAGRLIIGPWYSQTDEMVVSGESVVRNLLYGMRDCLAFGEPMKIGYLPDSFSQSAQIPQILNGFGITRALFWRGASERHGTNKTEFLWQGNGNSEVVAQILPLGYAIGKYLPEDETELKKRLDKYLPVLDRASVTGDLLLPNGHDQMPIQKNIFTIMDKLRKLYPEREFKMSRYEEVFERIEALRDQLDVVSGEFNDGKYMRVHRTIYSTRMDIKISHAEIENKITNILEPLASIAYSLGFEYHHGLLEKIWKEIMKNHAHDSICCCCSDIVHREILARFELAHDMADNLIRFYLRKIVDHMPKKENTDKLTSFNFAPYARKEVINATIRIRALKFALKDEQDQDVEYFIRDAREIDPGLVDRQIVHYGNYTPFMEYDIQFVREIPAMGFVTCHIYGEQDGKQSVAPANQQGLENKFYRVHVHHNGTLTVEDKQTGQIFTDVFLFEEGSDDGDEYDYSPSREEWLITNQNCVADIKYTYQAHQQHADIKLSLAVPMNLTSRAARKLDSKTEISFRVTLTENSRRIDVDMNIDNHAEDHRLRVLVPTPYATETVMADNQFGTISRPTQDPAMANWEKEGWDEAPIPVWQLLNFAAIENDKGGMALFTEGLREFEVIGNPTNTFALTLFRSIGLLGKEELLLRPGRPSGIKLPTPDSQMLGKLHCRFAIYPYQGDMISALIPQHAKEFVTPIQNYNKIPYDAMKLNLEDRTTPLSYSLFSKQASGAVLSVVKKAEDEKAILIRVYNPSLETIIDDQITFARPIETILEVNLYEKACADVQTKPECLKIQALLPGQVKTYQVTFQS